MNCLVMPLSFLNLPDFNRSIDRFNKVQGKVQNASDKWVNTSLSLNKPKFVYAFVNTQIINRIYKIQINNITSIFLLNGCFTVN